MPPTKTQLGFPTPLTFCPPLFAFYFLKSINLIPVLGPLPKQFPLSGSFRLQILLGPGPFKMSQRACYFPVHSLGLDSSYSPPNRSGLFCLSCLSAHGLFFPQSNTSSVRAETGAIAFTSTGTLSGTEMVPLRLFRERMNSTKGGEPEFEPGTDCRASLPVVRGLWQRCGWSP